MDDYIKREDAIEAAKHAWAKGLEPLQYIEIIPAADVAPMRHRSIIETIEDGRMKRIFSCCGVDFTEMTCWITPNFCPNCGAKMDGERREEK